MSELPESWAVAQMSEIVATTSGGTPSRSRSNYYGGSIPWVKSGELRDGFVDKTEESITEEGLKNSSAKVFRAGTLCIALYGATVGRVGILQIDAATNQAVCGIVPSSGIQTKYLFYYLLYQRRSLISMSQGGAQPNISQGIVRALQLPICAPAEQSRIVAEIEKQFTRLDAATAALKRVQANLKRYRASVLKAACEGSLVPTEAELARKEGRDYEPASELLKRILRERRARREADTLAKMIASGKRPTNDRWKQKYKEPSAPNTTNLPELPEGWSWTLLEQLSFIQGGITKGQKRKAGDRLKLIPYLRVANVQRGFLDLSEVKEIEATEEEIEELTLFPNDILFNEGGDRDKLGRGWIWENQITLCIHQNHVFRARLVLPEVQARYVSHYANAFGQRYFFDEGKHTTNLASLSMTKLKALPVPLPPVAEQARIVEAVTTSLGEVDRETADTSKALIKSDSLRRAILTAAFTGQLVPQDPFDEPASVLLERIRAERNSGYSRPPRRSRKAATNG